MATLQGPNKAMATHYCVGALWSNKARNFVPIQHQLRLTVRSRAPKALDLTEAKELFSVSRAKTPNWMGSSQARSIDLPSRATQLNSALAKDPFSAMTPDENRLGDSLAIELFLEYVV